MEARLTPATIQAYLGSRRRAIRWWDWLHGRRYYVARFPDPPVGAPRNGRRPLVVVAHGVRAKTIARAIGRAVEQDWAGAPEPCRESYAGILASAPDLVIIQLRRKNLCGCLGHRHVAVREPAFSERHQGFRGATAGEMDLAYERIETWPALPLMDAAWDSKFFEGSRQEEFRAEQVRLRLLSVLLHEIHHLVFPEEPEESVRQRSLAFYRDALASYVENTCATLSFTIDRSFSRLG